jgi:CheY-like chemotaxis protein
MNCAKANTTQLMLPQTPGKLCQFVAAPVIFDVQRTPAGAIIHGVAEPYVLLVDDEALLREALVRGLKSLGYRSIAVEGADAAITEITKELPFAVIADMVMPGHDGLWLLEQIRIHWPSLWVIMASGANLDEQSVLKARRLGANDFIAKPFGRETLYQALLRAAKASEPA